MLPWCQRHAAPLISDVGQESDHSGVIRSQGIPLQGVSEAPIDHLGQGNDLSDLLLELGIGLRVCVGRIGMTLVAGNFIFPKGGSCGKAYRPPGRVPNQTDSRATYPSFHFLRNPSPLL